MMELFNLIIKEGLSPNQFYLLYSMKEGISTLNINIHQELRQLDMGGWIVDNNLSPKAHSLIQQVEGFFKVQKKKTSNQLMGKESADNINKYREIFPKIRLPSGQYARQDPKNLETAFRWFFDNYSYSWETILEATARYVDQYERQNYKFMQTSQYFIRKQQSDKTWGSELANRCSVVETGEDEGPEITLSEKVV